MSATIRSRKKKLVVRLDTPCLLCNKLVTDEDVGSDLPKVVTERRNHLNYITKSFKTINVVLHAVNKLEDFGMICFCPSCVNQIELVIPILKSIETLQEGVKKFAVNISSKLKNAYIRKLKDETTRRLDSRDLMIKRLRRKIFFPLIFNKEVKKKPILNIASGPVPMGTTESIYTDPPRSVNHPWNQNGTVAATSIKNRLIALLGRGRSRGPDSNKTSCEKCRKVFHDRMSRWNHQVLCRFKNRYSYRDMNSTFIGNNSSVSKCNSSNRSKVFIKHMGKNGNVLSIASETIASNILWSSQSAARASFTQHGQGLETELYYCEVCSNVYVDYCSYKSHKCNIAAIKSSGNSATIFLKRYFCSLCATEATNSVDIIRHVLNCVQDSHSSDLNKSDKVTLRKKRPFRRTLVQKIEGKFKCKECGSLFQHKRSLQRHFRATHKNNQTILGYRRQPNVRLSTLKTSGDATEITVLKPDAKKLSVKSYAIKKRLKVLKSNRHSSIRRKCSKCSLHFESNESLKKHELALHPTKGFLESSSLCKVHGNFDTKAEWLCHSTPSAKSFHRCATCGKYFKNRNRLVEHEKRHTGIRDCRCVAPRCFKEFLCYPDLRKHIKRVHKENTDYLLRQAKFIHVQNRLAHNQDFGQYDGLSSSRIFNGAKGNNGEKLLPVAYSVDNNAKSTAGTEGFTTPENAYNLVKSNLNSMPIITNDELPLLSVSKEEIHIIDEVEPMHMDWDHNFQNAWQEDGSNATVAEGCFADGVVEAREVPISLTEITLPSVTMNVEYSQNSNPFTILSTFPEGFADEIDSQVQVPVHVDCQQC